MRLKAELGLHLNFYNPYRLCREDKEETRIKKEKLESIFLLSLKGNYSEEFNKTLGGAHK
jgi:hypothetical protein